MTKIENIQAVLRERGIDAWLFCDHHHRDATAYRIFGPARIPNGFQTMVLSDSRPRRTGQTVASN